MNIQGPRQPQNASYGAAAADWVNKNKTNPELFSAPVSIARTDSKRLYHADTLAYANEDIKNMGGTNGTLSQSQYEKAFTSAGLSKTQAGNMFNVLDTNHDKKIDASENQAYIELQDQKQDGKVSLAEMGKVDNLINSDPTKAGAALTLSKLNIASGWLS